MLAYFMGPVQDQRDECRLDPSRNATPEDLNKIGVKLCTFQESSLNQLFGCFVCHCTHGEVQIFLQDEWIRIPVKRGDFVFLPAGIYHRFTTDKKEDLIAIRLFKTVPQWEAFNRCADGDLLEERKDYLKSLLKSS
ncbi:unnamed protein product [Haemonchus placei]|uniref:acireductone dioxygenase (Fe(2+)-requiring) n=1 Tax=Haemonchus placei TaxID=6290 RepID=A0A0N4WE04_HAEPC|nr:unnamed protein product [Haemonchus placei]